ncbi:MAG: Gldg family protein, partial [Cyanobacteria bacterium P01_A01_bin.114]
MKFQKYLKLLIWPGIATIAAGGVAGFVGGWKILPIVLLILGAVLCGVAISLGGYGLSTFLKSRSTQAGTNALVATLSVLLILGVVNFLGARYDQRIDLTDAQLYTLAPESQTVVRNLPQPVEVMVFDEVPNATDKKLLESYRRFNTDFDYEYVNPLTEPQRAIDFGVQSRPAREAYLQAGEQRLLIQRLAPQEPLSEREITNRLKQLGRENEAVVYFLQGHGE